MAADGRFPRAVSGDDIPFTEFARIDCEVVSVLDVPLSAVSSGVSCEPARLAGFAAVASVRPVPLAV